MEVVSSSSSCKVPRGKTGNSSPPQSPKIIATRRVSTVDLTGESPTTSTTLVASIPSSCSSRGSAFFTTIGHDASFPVKLHQLLSSCDESVIRWQPENDGKSFTILNGGAFERDVLPMLYKNANIEMFGQLLSLYGFQRVDNGPYEGDYFHAMFMRDKPHLAHLIRQVSDSHYNHTHGPISYSALSSRLADSLAFKNTMASSMQATVTARLQGLRFPAKLHYLLCHGVYDLGFEGVMSWQPGGHSFAIQNTEDFEMQGLAEMLGTPGHASFRAQVFLHGFQRVRSDESDRVEVYYHPDFVREQPHLCRLIQIRNHLNTAVIRGTATACRRPNGTRLGVVSPPSTKSTKAVIELPKSIFVDYRSSSLVIGNPAGDYNPCNGRPAANDPGVNIISVTPKKRPRLGHAMTQNYFPFKLHSLLTLAEKFGCQNLLCWAPHGRCFVINDKDLFCESVLPLFRHSEFASFRAQLKAYGFQRTNQAGPDRGAYFHPCFLRGRAELCATITRRPKNLNGTIRGRPKGSQAYSEPEFYRMKFLPDLDVGAVIPPPGPIKDVLEAALTQITPPAPSIVAIAKINHRVDSPNGDIEGRESIKLRDDMEQTFPMKLHTLLSAQEHQVSNFVTWSDSGRSFNITDKMAFEASGCARLGLSSLAHFIEELVAFEFKRDEQTGAYYHEMFLKALPHLSRCIKRAVTFPKAVSCNSSIHEARAAVMATATRGNNLGDSCSSNSTAASESDPSELEVAAALAAMDDRSAQERAPATTTMVPVSPLTSDELSNASGSDLGAASSRRLSATVPMSVFSLACKLPSTILPFETVTVTSKRRQMSDPPGRYEMQQAEEQKKLMKEKEESEEQQCNGDAAMAKAQPSQNVAMEQTRQEPKLAKTQELVLEIVDITGTNDEPIEMEVLKQGTDEKTSAFLEPCQQSNRKNNDCDLEENHGAGSTQVAKDCDMKSPDMSPCEAVAV